MVDFALAAKARNDLGKGASRRLRQRADEVPAIVYGGDKEPQAIRLSHNELSRALQNEAFYSHIIRLTVDGVAEDVILKDLQRHPARPLLLHADFQRVNRTTKLHMRVPLHFLNQEIAIGVKQQGGTVFHSLSELEVLCLPADLPEYIEVDLAAVELDQVLHISDLKLPAGVESVALAQGPDHDLPVVAIHKTRGGVAAGDTGEAGEAGGN